jgi:asparaginyl-tRNA synthetase
MKTDCSIERYLELEKPRKRAVLKIQSEIMYLVRKFFKEKGFLEVRAPIFEPFTDPGIRGAKFFGIDFYGKTYTLMSALTIHKPLLATHLGKIFSFCPCARREPEISRHSKRHLAEFYQIEAEMPERSYEDAMKVAEELLAFVISEIKDRCESELRVLKREIRTPKLPFKRLTHREAVDLSKKMGYEAFYDKELPWEAERAISMRFSEPFFIKQYPKDSRGFYDKEGKDFLLSFDMLYPEGLGEASSGSEREFEYKKVLDKLKRAGDVEKFELYLQIMKRGVKPTSGFGIGLERLTRFICGLEDIKEAAPFSKSPG